MHPGPAAALIRDALLKGEKSRQTVSSTPDEELTDDWRDGGYPYRSLMLRRNDEKQKYRLQVERLKL